LTKAQFRDNESSESPTPCLLKLDMAYYCNCMNLAQCRRALSPTTGIYYIEWCHLYLTNYCRLNSSSQTTLRLLQRALRLVEQEKDRQTDTHTDRHTDRQTILVQEL